MNPTNIPTTETVSNVVSTTAFSQKIYTWAISHPNILLGIIILLICYIIYLYFTFNKLPVLSKMTKKKESPKPEPPPKEENLDEQTDKLIESIEEKQKQK